MCWNHHFSFIPSFVDIFLVSVFKENPLLVAKQEKCNTKMMGNNGELSKIFKLFLLSCRKK